MNELMTPTLAGAAAGLGVAMPMGAMSVLLLQEAMRDRRTAVAAAAGIAAVDLGYAALATALGPWVASHISPVEAWVRLASAVILLVIAAHGLYGSSPTSSPTPAPAAGPTSDSAPASAIAPASASAPVSDPPSASAPVGGPNSDTSPASDTAPASAPAPASASAPASDSASPAGRPAKAFVRYVGLTALNPTTALYFAALTTAQGAALGTGSAGAAFLLGVGAASLLWQQALVTLGSLAGTRVPAGARVWTFRLGYGLVAAYALKIAFPLPTLG
ncbi:LysE type translocator [Streptomyces sp. CG 926]|uniref:LysE family transporter n=1 Tax=Streptomyces sp. CG 926 TaxID=1882405 RepID=UPI000D6B07B7|nr:LysE family transporter [Streptomyces sp. CG 926]PWK73569.1 LysE type translocator [Streptomyces sp. CG 926]